MDDRGNRAAQSLTKGAECRPSRERLSDEAFPTTHKSGHAHGNDDPEQPSSGRHFHTRRAWRGETNTCVSTRRSERILETGTHCDDGVRSALAGRRTRRGSDPEE